MTTEKRELTTLERVESLEIELRTAKARVTQLEETVTMLRFVVVYNLQPKPTFIQELFNDG